MICRSALYIPASNTRALAKGPTLSADALIIDLEDSVAPASKAPAREHAVQYLKTISYGYRQRVLRVNTADTEWFDDDMAAAARCAPDAILLPKVETVRDIAHLSQAMGREPTLKNTKIWALMESPSAVINAATIAASVNHYPRLTVFVVGSNDLVRAAGMKIQTDRTCLMPWLMALVAAAKAHGLQIIDGVYNNFTDSEGFASQCAEGVAMGMDGKSVIHPSQLTPVNTAFSPSVLEIAEAREIVQAFSMAENSDKGAISLHGSMLERLHLQMAEKLLQRAELIAQRT